MHDILIVGGGIAGLALARELADRGRRPVVLERAQGVGGRCATRRIDGQPVDHGPAFLHGRSARFLAELNAACATEALAGWPRVSDGGGVPCQPRAFEPGDTRLAPAAGVSVLARHLARGLDIRRNARVEALTLTAAPDGPGRRVWEARLASGEHLLTPTLALAVPAPSALALLEPLGATEPPIAALQPLLRLIQVVPCLTVIARFSRGTTAPAWHASYPESSTVQAILHDSSKQGPTARLTLVVQARPGFSQAHVDGPDEVWARRLLDEAATLYGGWMAAPELVQAHRWRYARVAAGTELAAPLVAHCAGGAVVGIAGDGLDAAGGLEGAYLSGVALATRLTQADDAARA